MRTGSLTAVLLLFLVLCAASALLMTSAHAVAGDDDRAPEGYTDSELLPGGEWTVHDPRRPAPAKVTPGPGAGLGTAPPDDAIVLFDGTSTDAFEAGGEPIGWSLDEDGGMTVVAGTGSIQTRRAFGDCQLHIEWASPTEIVGDGQGRGNSGVFLMGRYEVQILDSFVSRTYSDGQAAALYGQFPPLVNACREPGEWQGYDITFRRPRFADDGSLVSPARVTVLHNGVLVHDAREMVGATSHKNLASYSAHADKLPFGLQDHGNPVRFRNIWIRELE